MSRLALGAEAGGRRTLAADAEGRRTVTADAEGRRTVTADAEGRRTVTADAEGRHTVVLAARAALAADSAVRLPEPEPAPGLILPDGSVNWGCPCLGGMATGPCGPQFRDAFSCFHYSEADPKGSDCYEKFSVMQECMSQYPELYAKDDDDEDELAAALDSAQSAAPASASASDPASASASATAGPPAAGSGGDERPH